MCVSVVTVEQLTSQLASLTAVVTAQQKIIKRVVLQPPVELRSFNTTAHFYAPSYRSLGELFAHACKEFDIDRSRLTGQERFYWLPSGDLSTADRINNRVTLRTEKDWERFLDRSDQSEYPLVTLYFVTGDLSPALFERPAPPSPPRLSYSDEDEQKSEPESVNGLAERDGGMCFICGKSKPVAAHVVDKHRSELLCGAPDAPDVDDLRNHFQLCPNHHASFDRFEWTLVEVKLRGTGVDYTVVTSSSGCSSSSRSSVAPANGFYVRACPLAPHPDQDIVIHMQTLYQFSNPGRAPPAYSFLLKQLGRFKVPCRVCGSLWLPSALSGHYGGTHKTDAEKSLWKDLPHLLPHPCECTERGETVWDLYCHVLSKHPELLYL